MNLSYEFGMADRGLIPVAYKGLLLGYRKEQQAFIRQRDCQIWLVYNYYFSFSRMRSMNE